MLRVFLVIDDYNELLYLQTLLKKLGFDTEGLQNTKKYADVSLGFNPHVLITTAHGRKVNGIDLIRTIQRPRGLPKIIALHSTEAPIIEDDVKGLGIDLILESPTSAKKLIMGLAQICDLDVSMLLEKYNKIRATVGDNAADDEMMIISYDETGKEVSVQPKLFKLNEDRPIGVQFPLKKTPVPEDPGVDTVEIRSGETDMETDMETEENSASSNLISKESTAERRQRFDEFLAKAEKPKPGHYDRDRITQFNKKIRSAPAAPDAKEIESDRKAFVHALFEKDKKS
jgi:DNA-binding response OmpR family regulator